MILDPPNVGRNIVGMILKIGINYFTMMQYAMLHCKELVGGVVRSWALREVVPHVLDVAVKEAVGPIGALPAGQSRRSSSVWM